MEFRANTAQQQVIDFVDGDALVLAPPGCGKTDVLTHRIIKARHDYGVPYSDMLCLTFTNRAMREMKNRVRSRIDEPTNNLFIGNLHRFCMRFLVENNLLKLDTSIIDEDDQTEIIAEISGITIDKPYIGSKTNQIVAYANIRTRMMLGFPDEFVNLTRSHLQPLRDNEHDYVTRYIEYKEEHGLIDYDDIINLAYKAMLRPDFKSMKMSDYPWIQVDEVQDLNPLQLAIIERILSPRHTIVYLGDERQSIFSFIGASLSSLQRLKHSMRVFTFSTNYRCPKYLVDFVNLYAMTNLGLKENELPRAANDIAAKGALVMLETQDSYNFEQEILIAAQTRQLASLFPGESIGILTRTNRRVNTISELFDKHHIEHLKLNNKDRFKMRDFKTVYSHLAVVANEHLNSEWARILYCTGTVVRLGSARAEVARFRKIGLAVSDLLRADGSCYLLDFNDVAQRGQMVVFDTETTGLDVFNDDVIQIAAVKIDASGIVPGSEFEVMIQTDKTIPETLGDGTPNPMADAYRCAEKTSFAKAFDAFMQYAGCCPLIAHNSDFDVNILLNNLRRRADATVPLSWLCECRDSLKIARLVSPHLRSHSLASLLAYYGLPEMNTHNAADDVRATAALVLCCLERMQPILPLLREALASNKVKWMSRRLRTRYKSYYDHTREKLYSPDICTENTLVSEFEWTYRNFLADGFIKKIPKFEYITELFRKVLVDPEREPYFMQQLLWHVNDMRTFSESDFFHNGVVKENVHIMTIHKAKGLQFDNVFVYAADEIPWYVDYKDPGGALPEAARVLYVAISRARHRLFICYNHKCSRFIDADMQSMFVKLTPQQVARVIQLENVFKDIE